MYFHNYILVFSLLYSCTAALSLTKQFDGRIVGGTQANISSFPYQVSLRRYNNHVCGGAIFHPSYILTAAHCVMSGLAKWYSIRAGSSTLNTGGTVVKVCSIRSHENYNAATMDNDIAILTLCSPLTFDSSMLPVALPMSTERLPAGTVATITGWGLTTESGAISAKLRKVQVPIVDQKQCCQIYAAENVTSNMICAGYVGKGGKDACQGDSGGPMMARGKLFGVVSWGYGCARAQYPGVYTNLPNYRTWIKEITKY